MAIIVVGGSSRKVGKTSVVVGIMAALPQYRWTAFKVTPHVHETNSGAAGKATRAISEEKDRHGNSDTSRYLAAGADRVFLVQAESAHLAEAMLAVRQLLAQTRNAIVESNSIMQFLQPDRFLLVLDPAADDFKASAREFLLRADALIVHEAARGNEMNTLAPLLASLRQKTVFLIRPPEYVTPEIIDFVKPVLSR